MREDMLRNIEYLRERADVSYEDAATLLENNDGDVIRALMVLERQGRLYHAKNSNERTGSQEQWQNEAQEAKKRAKSFVQKAFKKRLVIERKGEDGAKETVMNVSMPLVVGAAIVAPYLAVASAAISVATGCSVKVENSDLNE